MNMKCFLLVIGLLVVFIMEQAYADVDSCYTCASLKSWEDCNSKMTKTSCSGKCGSKTCDTCAKQEANASGVKAYVKGCTLESICEASPDICAVTKKECSVWCCSGDDCNGVGTTMASFGVVTIIGLFTVIKNTLLDS